MNQEDDYVGLNDRLDFCSPEMQAIYREIEGEIAAEQALRDAENGRWA